MEIISGYFPFGSIPQNSPLFYPSKSISFEQFISISHPPEIMENTVKTSINEIYKLYLRESFSIRNLFIDKNGTTKLVSDVPFDKVVNIYDIISEFIISYMEGSVFEPYILKVSIFLE